jgi:hypothetical protein
VSLAVLALAVVTTASRAQAVAAPSDGTSADFARCARAVAALVREWTRLGRVFAPVSCVPRWRAPGCGVVTEYGAHGEVASYVVFADGRSESFYREIAAHELGHAYAFAHSARDWSPFLRIRGSNDGDENYADTFAFAFGEYRQHDRRVWRTGGPGLPTAAQIHALREARLLP